MNVKFRFQIPLVLLFAFQLGWAGAKLVIQEDNFDFGALIQGDVVTHSFELANNGDGPLTISKVTPSCGCTIGRLSKETLKPREKGSLEITFNSERFTGPQHKSITIASNDPENPTLQIRFTAQVQIAYEITPPFVNFHGDKEGLSVSEKEIELLLVNRHTVPLIRVDVALKDAPVKLNSVFPLNLSLKTGDTLRIKITPDIQGKISNSQYGSLDFGMDFSDNRKLEKRIGVTIKKWR